MAEPTSAMSFADLIIRVAEFAGIPYYGPSGDQKALVPIDTHDLDLCKRIVNDGVRRFILAEKPSITGWRWQKRIQVVSLRVTTSSTATSGSATTLVDSVLASTYANDYYNNAIIEITGGTGNGESALITGYTGATGTFTFTALSGDSTPDTTTTYTVGHRYKMPDNFSGSPDGPITYGPNTNVGIRIDWDHEATIRAWQENANLSTSDPFIAALRPFGTRQHELLLYPSPSVARIVQFPYTVLHNNMVLEAGVATSGAATTLADSTRLEADDAFNGQVLTVVAGTGVGQTATITDYTGSSGTFTFTALSGGATPDTTSVYNVEPATDNTHPAGMRFDFTVISACLAETESQIDDIQGGKLEEFIQLSLPQAYTIDNLLAPPNVGNLTKFTQPRRILRAKRLNVTFE